MLTSWGARAANPRPDRVSPMSEYSIESRVPIGRANLDLDVLAPDGSEIRLLIDQRHASRRASPVEVALAAGQVSRPVWHRTVEEIWYILEGCGQVWRCPPGVTPETVQPVPISPGDALVITTEWRFQFSADEGGLLRFLCYTSPPWPGPEEAPAAELGGLGPATV